MCYVCADLHSQPLGATRSLTSLFREQRKNKRVNLLDELSRLVHGFQHNVDPSSRIKTAVTDVFTIKVPEWQKSHKWQVMMYFKRTFNLSRLAHEEPIFSSYRNQSVNLYGKSIHWFLCDGDIGRK